MPAFLASAAFRWIVLPVLAALGTATVGGVVHHKLKQSLGSRSSLVVFFEKVQPYLRFSGAAYLAYSAVTGRLKKVDQLPALGAALFGILTKLPRDPDKEKYLG